MAIVVQQTLAQESNPAHATTFSSVTTVGGRLLVIWTSQVQDNTSTVSISDTASNTWVQTPSGYTSQSSIDRGGMWYVVNSTALSNGSITITWNGMTDSRVDAIFMEISGIATSSPFESSANSNGAASTSSTSGAISTVNANDILIMGQLIGGGYSAPVAGSGFTIPSPGSAARSVLEYQIVSATQSNVTTSLSWTSSLRWANTFAAFSANSVSSSTGFEDDSFNASTNFSLIQQAEPVISVF